MPVLDLLLQLTAKMAYLSADFVDFHAEIDLLGFGVQLDASGKASACSSKECLWFSYVCSTKLCGSNL